MIIAECGQNHASLDEAKQLIILAKQNGADFAKFQLFDSAKLYDEHNPSELTKAQAKELYDMGEDIGIEVFFSVFDIERVDWCEEIGVKRYKLAARMQDEDILKAVKETDKPIYISRDPNLPWLYCDGAHYLYCIAQYPATIRDYKIGSVNFNGMPYIGISDHTIGLDLVKAAIARGAQIIEKHFALDHKTGMDAEWGMTPDELRELVEYSSNYSG
jgi:sialic acid synthase SpsE